MTTRKERKTYSEEFKKQIVGLYNNGKSGREIIAEYGLTESAFYRWVQRVNKTGSTKEKENRSSEERELLDLRKENKRLKMENDVLKQAALIMGRKFE